MPIARLSPPTTGRVPPRYVASPGTRLAWWALGLDVPAVALLVLAGALAAAGVPDAGGWAQLAVGLTGAAGALVAIVAGALAAVALVRGERSLLLLVPLLLGAFWAVFLVGEVVSGE
ncbi:MAG TPA: hypothetical protein VNK94_12970 [Gaiellaceae bacterium]|nr:hypothetical protein [Gaiellaceae bacterium]